MPTKHALATWNAIGCFGDAGQARVHQFRHHLEGVCAVGIRHGGLWPEVGDSRVLPVPAHRLGPELSPRRWTVYGHRHMTDARGPAFQAVARFRYGAAALVSVD